MAETGTATDGLDPQADTKPQVGAGGEGQGSEQQYSAKYVKELRDEAAKYRLKAKEYEDAQKAAQDAALKEQGKWQEIANTKEAELAKLAQSVKQSNLKAEVAAQAVEQGVKNVTALLKLVKDDVQFGEDGSPLNVAELVKAALVEVPGLVEKAKPLATAGAPMNTGKVQAEVPTYDPKKVRLTTPGIWDNFGKS